MTAQWWGGGGMTIVHVSEGGMSKCLHFDPPPPPGAQIFSTHKMPKKKFC